MRGDVGGFGIGSNFSFNAVGKAGYQIIGDISLEAGAKWISIDFEDGNPASGGFLYDISHFGFLFGVGINTARP